jgi:hypothetical protein
MPNTSEPQQLADYDRPVRVSEIKSEIVNWIVPGWIPAGKISILYGDPGLGKSLVTLDLAARITSGEPMPLCETPHPPSNVLLFCAEDEAADTIKPRLEAAGADCNRVHVFPNGGYRMFSDHKLLYTLITMNKATLVVVDPLSLYAGRRDICRDQQVRRLLGPIARIAAMSGSAFLFVHHPNKSAGRKALLRSAGSIGIAATARSVMIMGKDPTDPASRIIAQVKGNLGAAQSSLRFHFEHETGRREPRVRWDGAAKGVTADSLMQTVTALEGAHELAGRFLRDALSGGPRPSKELEELAIASGIRRATFIRAKLALTHSVKTGGIGNGAWETHLNQTSPD